MPAFVLDSSMALAWYLPRQQTQRTDALFVRTGEEGAIATSLWPVEVSNVLLVYERRKLLTAADRAHAISIYARLPIDIDEATAAKSWNTTYDLALAHGLTIYDAGYLELSLRTGLALATLDKALARAAAACGVPLMMTLE
jgi:predicted nucleic acid-binding protein